MPTNNLHEQTVKTDIEPPFVEYADRKFPEGMPKPKNKWSRAWNYFKKKPEKYKGTRTNLDDIPMWNIYDPTLSNRKLFRKFNFFQVFIKYKLIVPFLIIIERSLNKFNGMGRENYEKSKREWEGKIVPDYHYNKNILIFEDAFEKALKDWVELYIRRGCEQKWKDYDYQNGGSARMLRTMKNLVVGGALFDTAYREFFNMLMFHLGRDMSEEYNGRTVHHLLYPSNTAYNVQYWAISQQLQNRIDLENVSKTRDRKNNSGTASPNGTKV